MQKIFIAAVPVLVTFLTAACAKTPAPASPPAPCTVGVNSQVCDTNIRDVSAWKSTTTLSYSAAETPATAAPAPSATPASATSERPSAPADSVANVTRTISIYYEFTPEDGGQWRRTIQVSTPNELSRSMIQSGRVIEVTGDRMKLEMNSITCADEAAELKKSPQTILLYYTRNAGTLSIDYQPPQVAHNLSDAFGQIFTKILIDPMVEMMKMGFTFGSARNYMENSAMTLTTSPSLKLETIGQVGCFTSIGNVFLRD